jgi:hypothetical protein
LAARIPVIADVPSDFVRFLPSSEQHLQVVNPSTRMMPEMP